MTTSMRQWEYAAIRLDQFETVPPEEGLMGEPGFGVNVLDELGTEGWELVSVDLPFAFLKRPV